MSSDCGSAFIDLRAITKRYAGVTALDCVDFTVQPGEAVCLAGENGSGKSTLIKIISGVEPATEGTIHIAGEERTVLNPRISAAAGVMVIFQDFSLFPNLSVAENISFATQLSQHERFYKSGATRDIARKALDRIGVEIDLDARVEALPVAQKQLVAICRALASQARLIIMDEPTTALTEKEVRRLQSIIRMLKDEGVAVIFVSHKLAEVLEVSERVVVLRNGKKVAEGPAKDFDTQSLTYHMTGRDVPEVPPSDVTAGAETLMQVKRLTKADSFSDITFDLKVGEVLGITGLLGSGRTSVAKALFGLVAPDEGTIAVDGKPVPTGDPQAASQARIGYVPEDRLTEGLFLSQSILHNVAVGRLDTHSNRGLLDMGNLAGEASEWLTKLKVKAPDVHAPVQSLSGGNQQRVALARWLSRAPRVLILNGPSVGVDVGSKADIHDIIRNLATQGIGIIVISDDLPELLATCHRILVMRDGKIIDNLDGKSVTEDDLAHRLAS
ncbi:sugar ABC transporter ATP-binding protein [Tateyamaria omphalii]|uniref:sugar ABC transporter ATP-binding protein n=1 Tax=Tateyamaria omphalii TaxID=299262 RepID=UPI001C99B0EB|nr:sugar ABC transporter ATP-binding protein [Tateyamaria omphalii]MBY5934911.1 sugar ABC transporter ATP-binding protein [Tateyamaria omphalii]